MAARSGKLRVIPRSAVEPPLITTEQLRMMTVPLRILTVRKSVSTETVWNSVSTPYCVVHGYPRKARESDFCMYGGRRDQQGCVTVMQGCVTVMQGCAVVRI